MHAAMSGGSLVQMLFLVPLARRVIQSRTKVAAATPAEMETERKLNGAQCGGRGFVRFVRLS